MSTATESPAVALSSVESEHFGIRVARATRITASNLQEVLQFCIAGGIELLVARCDAGDLPAAQAMEAQGFLLTDTLVYYAFDLAKCVIPEDKGEFQVRGIQSADHRHIEAVAAAAFKGYPSHYHADIRLDRHKCDQAYISWAIRSCLLKEVAEQVFVAERGSRVAGFATLRLNSADEGEGLLYAVAPESQALGICRSLMISSLQWCRTLGAGRMIISTQVTNVAMQKVWCRVGFEPSHSYYTLHKWFT